jgi:CysZ protein
MIADFLSGTRYLGEGFRIIRQPGLRRFVAIPLAINVVIFASLTILAYHYYSLVVDWFTPEFLAAWKDYWWIGWLVGIVEILLWLIFGTAVLIVLAYTFTLIANFIAAPFNSLLAEKVEHHLTGTLPESNHSISHVFRSIPKTMVSEIHKLIYLLLWMIPLAILSIIPLVKVISPLGWFIFGAWMLALEYLDYPMGNNDYRFGQIKRFMKLHRGLALGFGGGALLMTSIPVVNLLAMPVAVAGATSMWVNRLSLEAVPAGET